MNGHSGEVSEWCSREVNECCKGEVSAVCGGWEGHVIAAKRFDSKDASGYKFDILQGG